MMTIPFNSIMLKGPELVTRANKFGIESLNALEKKIYTKYKYIFECR